MNVSHNPLLLQPEQKLTPNIPVTVEYHLSCCSYSVLSEHLIFINLHIGGFAPHLPPGVILLSWRQPTLPRLNELRHVMGKTSCNYTFLSLFYTTMTQILNITRLKIDSFYFWDLFPFNTILHRPI